MNTDDFRTPTTNIVPVPKKAHKRYLDVTGQHNVDDSRDLGPAALNPDNHNGHPKKNGLNQKISTDVFRTPTTIVPVPKKARKSYLNVFGQRNADQENQDRVRDPRHLGPTALISDNYNGRPKNNQPMYVSDLLMRKRLILSNDVRKTTLIKHDERPNESKTEREDEDDETFFKNLKKRINDDLQKNILHKTPNPVPKRLSKARKCKTLLNNETRNLMNKFQQEFANNQSRKLLSQENEVFSMARRSNSLSREEHPDSEMRQRAVERNMTKDIMLEHHKTVDDSLRGTPPFHELHAKGCNHQLTPPSFERNRVFPMERRCNSWTGETISERQHPVVPQKVAKRRMTKDIPMKYFETDQDSIRSRSPFNEIHAEVHNRQPTPTSSERNGGFPMKCRGHSWTGENICEHTHQVMPQKIAERRMTRDIPMKYVETDEDSLRSRQPINEIHVETHNRLPTPTSSERNGVFPMKCRGHCWTGKNNCEHTHQVMPQKIAERRMTRDIPMKYVETDEDSLRSRQPINEIHGETHNRLLTPSPSQSNEAFSMERRSSSWTRGNICEHLPLAMPQSVMEHNRMKYILWEHCGTVEDSLQNTLTFGDMDGEAYYRQPSSTQRTGAFLMDRRSNNTTRESICEHRHPVMAQNVVERRPTKDIMFQYFETDKDSLYDTPSFSEIHTEAYDRQPTFSSSGSNAFVKYYTKKYYQK